MCEVTETEKGLLSMPIYTPTYDVGWDGYLRLSALLRWQQEAGERHLRRYDMSWDTLMQQGMAFVLTRAAGEIFARPRAGEAVRLETWQRKVSGASFLRGYRLRNEQGERLTECVSTFGLVDAIHHRLLRTDVLADRLLPSLEREDSCAPPRRLRVDEAQLTPVGTWTVHRSTVDFNRHLNNTVYADLLTDFLPEEVAVRPLRRFTLQLEHEVRGGEELALRYAALDGAHYVAGFCGEGRHFIGCVETEG